MYRASHGFTLVELMITLALAAILVTVGVPSFQQIVERNQLTSTINQFVSSLSVARSEAIKRKLEVAVCPSQDGITCNPTSGFENGWIVYVESVAPRNNRDVDNEELIWSQEALANGLTLVSSTSATQNSLIYSPNGRISGISRRVTLCKEGEVDRARALTIITTGRVHQAELNADNIPIVAGSAISECT